MTRSKWATWGRLRHKWAYNIKTDIKEIYCKDVNWNHRVLNKDYKQTFLNTIITFMFHIREFLDKLSSYQLVNKDSVMWSYLSL
jgi:hypothetical protein